MVVRVLMVMSQSSMSHTLRIAALGFRNKPLARIWGVGRGGMCVSGMGTRREQKVRERTEWE